MWSPSQSQVQVMVDKYGTKTGLACERQMQ